MLWQIIVLQKNITQWPQTGGIILKGRPEVWSVIIETIFPKLFLRSSHTLVTKGRQVNLFQLFYIFLDHFSIVCLFWLLFCHSWFYCEDTSIEIKKSTMADLRWRPLRRSSLHLKASLAERRARAKQRCQIIRVQTLPLVCPKILMRSHQHSTCSILLWEPIRAWRILVLVLALFDENWRKLSWEWNVVNSSSFGS